MKNFLSMESCNHEEIQSLLNRSKDWKQKSKDGIESNILNNKVIGMIFEKPSTRTRVAFEVAINKLGGTSLFLNSNDLQLSRNEPIKDTARVLSSYLNCLIIRTHKHEVLEEFAQHSTVPIINGLSAKEHPCQTLADLMTIQEILGTLTAKKVVYSGRYNNVAHSLMIGCLKMGMVFCLLGPKAHMPSPEIIEHAKEITATNSGTLLLTEEIKQGIEGSHIVYTDVWRSMGEENIQFDQEKLMNYQVNSNLLKYSTPDVKVMHCLPAKLDEEITHKVFEDHGETIFQQAENRLYTHMAILEEFLS